VFENMSKIPTKTSEKETSDASLDKQFEKVYQEKIKKI